MSKPTLIFIRHGHRSKAQGQRADNGLSEKGKTQALKIRDHWAKKLRNKKVSLLSSPKQRCRETLEPLARALDLHTRTFKLLDEQGHSPPESAGVFLGRIRRLLSLRKKSQDEVWVICSHGDWIPECLRLLRGSSQSIDKGDWIAIRQKEKKRGE